MSENKQDLVKLLDFIIEISSTPNNNWFRKELVNKLVPLTASKSGNNPEISEIHEYCIKKILQDQAKMFYKDFNLPSINDELCNDYVRMEQYRREDNFEEFCMAMFQQIELIVNTLSNNYIENYTRENWNTYLLSWIDKNDGSRKGKLLWQFIFNYKLSQEDLVKKINKPIIEWDFNEKYKSVLVYNYFNKVLSNYKEFDLISNGIYELYQVRNLNHRGGKKTPKQIEVTSKIKESKSKYYFKFLGLFEDFVTRVNMTIN
jgi:hypothetical protein